MTELWNSTSGFHVPHRAHRLNTAGSRSDVSCDRIAPCSLEHVPSRAPDRADRVAVRAYQLALRDLSQDLFSIHRRQSADVAQLLVSREMIPLHRLRWVDLPAIGAGLPGLQRTKPENTAPFDEARPVAPRVRMGLQVTVMGEAGETRLAGRLVTIPPSAVQVVILKRLRLFATRAALHPSDSSSVRYQKQ